MLQLLVFDWEQAMGTKPNNQVPHTPCWPSAVTSLVTAGWSICLRVIWSWEFSWGSCCYRSWEGSGRGYFVTCQGFLSRESQLQPWQGGINLNLQAPCSLQMNSLVPTRTVPIIKYHVKRQRPWMAESRKNNKHPTERKWISSPPPAFPFCFKV